MKLLAWITELFIETFGITRPKPEQVRTTNLVIGGFLLAFATIVLGIVGFLVFQITAGSSH
ncbi:hypothetical protein [Alloacidobacterium sp.]|uniref:hypothetical protein n=1 Tax=Alloacidobacterium sp. TaxID=2951999 RepID=UPI002D742541|nr:hypothetical protein [Alloacidobacterium sp.]HYK38287.1 hypothetical protein [Alloacidobacterium sp.]